MVAAGFNNTNIIVPDGGVSPGDSLMTTIASDPQFASSVYGIGAHYPCNDPVPEITNDFHMPYWASEDYSTVADCSTCHDSQKIVDCAQGPGPDAGVEFSTKTTSGAFFDLRFALMVQLVQHEHHSNHCLVAHLECLSRLVRGLSALCRASIVPGPTLATD